MNMAHDAKTEQTVEDWLDSIEPNPADARDATHIRRIIAANDALRAAQAELQAAVAAARAAGDTWDAIGAALGVSRQAAYQRFGRREPVTDGPLSPGTGQKRVPAGSIHVGDAIFRSDPGLGEFLMIVREAFRGNQQGTDLCIWRGEVHKLIGAGTGANFALLGEMKDGGVVGVLEWKAPVDGDVVKAVPLTEADKY
ncbi:hypothetical protein BST27_18590 [Mycobacterium intermedium]|uniref:Uncharacterized protein n=1 Tax=Mycobacterium intermedium TaxID=28445 RepID=A0A1X0FGB5_MYCIE|nr:hypothetical protein [Mycobacterium intermedium]ORB00270.1 hypothetical protein BST27_18590 [Mycobacterium intermedium]